MRQKMDERPNLTELIEAGRQDEAIALLREEVMLRPVIGERSAIAALAFANALASGNLMGTARWMTKYSTALRGTATEIAETSEEGLQRVLTFISQIEHGGYI
jgi:hypothetical protein